MSLTEIMSQAGLHAYAEAALVIFLVVFAAVVVRVFVARRASHYEHLRRLPLDDDQPPTTRPTPSSPPGEE